MKRRMTPDEMLKMYLDGATYKQIAEANGISRQAAHQTVTKVLHNLTEGKRGRRFSYKSIIYKGIHDYFEQNRNATITSFARATSCDGASGKINTFRNFVTGANNSRFTIPQIKAICEICGKPFEEVFEIRETRGDT